MSSPRPALLSIAASCILMILHACSGGDPGSTESDASTSTGTSTGTSQGEDSGTTDDPTSSGTSTTSGPGSTGTGTTTGTSDTGSSSGPGPTSDSSDTGASSDTGSSDTGEPVDCLTAGGVCVAQGECEPAGGHVVGTGPLDCHFDDAPTAECCAPPEPTGPGTCNEQGGICASVTGCLQAGGYFTSDKADCGGAAIVVCCVPHVACGDQTIDCCEGDAVYNPACDAGAFQCVVGEPAPVGECM